MSEIKNSFLRKLSLLKESEDHIEFKEAKHNFDYNGGSHKDPKERRHCILGYVAALANEKGEQGDGYLFHRKTKSVIING